MAGQPRAKDGKFQKIKTHSKKGAGMEDKHQKVDGLGEGLNERAGDDETRAGAGVEPEGQDDEAGQPVQQWAGVENDADLAGAEGQMVGKDVEAMGTAAYGLGLLESGAGGADYSLRDGLRVLEIAAGDGLRTAGLAEGGGDDADVVAAKLGADKDGVEGEELVEDGDARSDDVTDGNGLLDVGVGEDQGVAGKDGRAVVVDDGEQAGLAGQSGVNSQTVLQAIGGMHDVNGAVMGDGRVRDCEETA